jgi:hexokinase
MANALYPLAKQEMLKGTVDLSGTNVKVALVNVTGSGTLYTYSAAHQFLSDINGASIIATSGNLASKTFVNGLFDADDITFSTVTGTVCEALIIYIDTGTGSTSKLIAYLDTSITGMPVTPGGGDILVVWDAAGIFQL